ncbi:uncharacterized protein LOC114184459 [Vigna unguiculata]|uniref:uncharacterized protein LOC114184459 n=1 Tax=Vigna unguiculata TaxID=3917 RepID=UPI001016B51E|nr:uncharacterized protein LOC114184459 [Vigna unguiculata]
MQQMEAARVAAEDAHRQHMEALRQLEKNRAIAPTSGLEPRPVVREWSLQDFLKQHPMKFRGKTSPDAAYQWLKDMERIFDAKYKIHHGGEGRTSDLGGIQEKFLSEYFPNSVRYAKEVEFLQLTQRNKSVADYAKKFKHLNRFYTLPLDEEWRCRKFENGLRGDIRLMVAPLSIKDFAALVKKARVMEKMKNEVEG